MRFMLEPVSGPEVEVLTLARVKREIDEFDDVTERDDDITARIAAAREWVEEYTGRVLVDSSFRLTIDQSDRIDMIDGSTRDGCTCGTFTWHRVGEILLRKAPALAITSFKVVDADGVETDVDAATYRLEGADSKFPRAVPKTGATWPSASLMRIVFRAGYADRTGSPQDDVSVVPEVFKQAMILWIRGNYNDEPESIKAAKALIRPRRVVLGMA